MGVEIWGDIIMTSGVCQGNCNNLLTRRINLSVWNELSGAELDLNGKTYNIAFQFDAYRPLIDRENSSKKSGTPLLGTMHAPSRSNHACPPGSNHACPPRSNHDGIKKVRNHCIAPPGVTSCNAPRRELTTQAIPSATLHMPCTNGATTHAHPAGATRHAPPRSNHVCLVPGAAYKMPPWINAHMPPWEEGGMPPSPVQPHTPPWGGIIMIMPLQKKKKMPPS